LLIKEKKTQGNFIGEVPVSAPVHPHVLIIVKTHENRVEHILANITNDLTAKNYF
jgi:hypothetical protein